MNKIFLEALRVDVVIGVFEWEKRIKQTVLIDLEMSVDSSAAAATDTLENTLDYKAVAKRIQTFVESQHFGLIETLAEKISDLIIQEFDVEQIKVKAAKPGAVRGAKTVGVIVEKRKDTG